MSGQIMVIAGEHSGDCRAAEVIAAVNSKIPGLKWFGIGGQQMRLQGVETRHDVDEMAVMGLGEVLRRYPFFKRVFHEMLAWAEERKPELVLLVDYPGFNLRLARKLHAKGIKTAFYICPQVWAWNRSRIPRMAKWLDHLLTIFPFEAELFRKTKLPVTYVGHPLVDSIRESRAQAVYQLPWNAIHRVALLPGSRPQEIERMLPVMLSAAAILEHRIVDCGFLIASAGGKQEQCILDILAAHPVKPGCLSVITDHTRDIVAQADAAMVCSGTATLETALLNCPMVVCYKAHPLAFKLIRPLIRVPYIGMVNIIAGREICPELLQNKATPEALAETIADLVRPGVRRLDMLHDLKEVQSRIGNGGAARNAAGVISDMLGHPTLTENDFRWT